MNKDEKQPITFLHAEPCSLVAVDQPEGNFAQENDTLNILSGDSDTN